MELALFVNLMELFLGLVLTLSFMMAMDCYMKMRKRRGGTRLPPGPTPWPVIGNMHALAGKLPHRDLAKLAAQYGPLLYLELGSRPALVASSAMWAKEIMQTHDRDFGTRPAMAISKDLAVGNLAFTKTGEYWRQMRKLAMLNLLSPTKIETWQGLRMEEVTQTLKRLSSMQAPEGLGKEKKEKEKKFVDMYEISETLTVGLMGRLLFTSDLSGLALQLKNVLKRINVELVVPAIVDFIPSLGFLDVLTNRKRAGFLASIHTILHEVIELRRAKLVVSDNVEQPQCFVDSLLALQQQNRLIDGSDEAIEGALSGLFAASIETTSTAMEWVMAELMNHPEKLRKVREEMEREVGGVHFLDDKEVGRLKYLEAVVKETLRLHPPVPLLLPRESMERCRMGEYEVPKGTMVLINAWAIGRDPKVWENPHEFIPERFYTANDIKGGGCEKEEGLMWHHGLVTFGGGRRTCPGKAVALSTINLTLANLLHSFDWKTSDEFPQALNMDEKVGIVGMRKDTPLMLIPTPRHTNF